MLSPAMVASVGAAPDAWGAAWYASAATPPRARIIPAVLRSVIRSRPIAAAMSSTKIGPTPINERGMRHAGAVQSKQEQELVPDVADRQKCEQHQIGRAARSRGARFSASTPAPEKFLPANAQRAQNSGGNSRSATLTDDEIRRPQQHHR